MTLDSTPPKMHITAEELSKTQIPLVWRDYCAHLLPALNKCRMDNYYKPWECELERIAWQKCQYDDYQRRMRKLSHQREAAAGKIEMDAAAELDH